MNTSRSSAKTRLLGGSAALILVAFLAFSYVAYPAMAKSQAKSQTETLVQDSISQALKGTPGIKVEADVSADAHNFISVVAGASAVKNLTVNVKSIDVDAAVVSRTKRSSNEANAKDTAKANEAQAKAVLKTLSDKVDVVRVKFGKVKVTNIGQKKQKADVDLLGSGFSIGRKSYDVQLNISAAAVLQVERVLINVAKQVVDGDPELLGYIPARAPIIKMQNNLISFTYDGDPYKFSAKPANGGKSISYTVNDKTTVNPLDETPSKSEPAGTLQSLSFNEVAGIYRMSAAGTITNVNQNLWRYLLDQANKNKQ